MHPETQVLKYARQLATLRQRSAPPHRDAYTVALGQLVQYGLLDRETYDELMALPVLWEVMQLPSGAHVAAQPNQSGLPRQDSLQDQLKDLHFLAAKFGMYDAADWLWKTTLREGTR